MSVEIPVPIDILLVEDDPGDVLLTKKALESRQVYNTLEVAKDGIEALEILRGEKGPGNGYTPDLILLDLNMPRMDGREFLIEMKGDQQLSKIPVVVLTTSESDKDILESYDLQASCYVTKPVALEQFMEVVNSIQDFWLALVKYPSY